MKNRMINTKFWSDSWILELNPLERYLFLYFLTNEHTNICGIYELPIRVIARESGIDDDMVKKMIKKMSEKIAYADGWICVKNFLRHQKASGNVKLGIEKGLNDVPKEIMAKLSKVLDTPPSVPQQSPKPELKLELELEDTAAPPPPPKKDILQPETLDEFVKRCESSSQRHIQIIGEWARIKKPDCQTYGQFQQFIKRHLRAAMSLSAFTDEQMSAGFKKIRQAEGEKWLTKSTLETLLKFII